MQGGLALGERVGRAGTLGRATLGARRDPACWVRPTPAGACIARWGALGRGCLCRISRLGVTGVRDDLAAHVHTFRVSINHYSINQ